MGGEVAADVATPRRAFLTALGGTASNPLTIGSWAAIFAAASVAGAADTTAGAVLLVAGVGAGKPGLDDHARLGDRRRATRRGRPCRSARRTALPASGSSASAAHSPGPARTSRG